MAAIAYPTPRPRQFDGRPALRLVRGVPRQSEAVYRRRRLAVVALLLAVVIAVGAIGSALLFPADASTGNRAVAGTAAERVVGDPATLGAEHLSPPAGSVYVVQPGDTLWSIARQLVPGSDVRDEVDHLEQLNGTAALEAGQHLRLAPAVSASTGP